MDAKKSRIVGVSMSMVWAILLVACGESSGNAGTEAATGGTAFTSTVTGGASSLGGAPTSASGGASTQALPTGGTDGGASGSPPATGGKSGVAAGGATASGGNSAFSSGGWRATGGTDSVANGGSPAAGGKSGGPGGRSSTSGGTTASGGSSGAGGQSATGSSNVGGAVVSQGCGKAPPPATTARQTMDVNGTTREFIIVYPTNYDPNHPYRVIYEFHGSGGTAEENINFKWYGVQPLSGNSVIFVAPQGLGSPAGWPNSGGQDVAFIKKLVPYVNETFCVDTTRVFATGFSYGAMFTNTLGCQMGDVFRAIAPASGGGPNGTCVGKPAAVVIHGSADTTVAPSSGMASRDHWIAANHCGSTTLPMEPSPCVVYQGCDPGYPVAWCEHSQGHMILSSFFGPAIWGFFSQF